MYTFRTRSIPTIFTISLLGAFLFILSAVPQAFAVESGEDHQVANPPEAERVVHVSSSNGLQKALNTALPGDHIVLADGEYSGTFKFTKSGQPGKPIVIKAENLHGATMQGTIEMRGAWQWIHGLRFAGQDSLVDMICATNAFVTRNHFAKFEAIKVFRTQNYKIGWNSFTGTPGNHNDSGSRDNIRIMIHASDLGFNAPTINGHIYRNSFTNSYNGDNGGFHAIYVGDYNPPNYPMMNLVIEHNYYNGNLRRIFYTKGPGITQQYNTMIGHGRGESGIRNGGHGKIWGNYMENINQFMIDDTDNDVRGNVLVGKSRFRVHAGTNQEPKRRAAHNSIFVGNSGPILVGWAEKRNPEPVRNITIEGHTNGAPEFDHAVRSTASLRAMSSKSSSYVPQMVKLSPDQVGPTADGSKNSY